MIPWWRVGPFRDSVHERYMKVWDAADFARSMPSEGCRPEDWDRWHWELSRAEAVDRWTRAGILTEPFERIDWRKDVDAANKEKGR